MRKGTFVGRPRDSSYASPYRSLVVVVAGQKRCRSIKALSTSTARSIRLRYSLNLSTSEPNHKAKKAR